jgi:hypothetical protein
MTGHKTRIPGFRISRKTGKPERIPKDASAAKRERPGGSKRIKYVRPR